MRRLAVLALASVVAACAPAAADSSAPQATDQSATATSTASATPASAAPARAPVALDGTPLESCAVGSGPRIQALCGELVVPEDPAAPDGRTIRLRVAVIPAATGTPQPDPVFMIAGGPGGSAVDTLTWTASVFSGIHGTRDIVLVDQRGTGRSNPLLLDPLPDLDGLDEPAARAAADDWATTQLARFDADPRFYTTSVAMDDLDAVRDALGYERINLWGGSYGATAAQYYVRQHPDRVRAVVLDGATLLEVPVFERIAANSQAALDALFARCEADPACHAAYPDLGGDFARVLETLAGGPVTTTIIDPATGEPGIIDPAVFAGAIHQGLLNADTSAMLPWLIHTAAEGRWDKAVQAAQAAGGGDPLDDAYPLMSAVIRCSEQWAVYDPAEVARTGAGSYYLDAQLEIARVQDILCSVAPHGVVPADDAAPAAGDMPVLFVVGSADPQDPPANIAPASERFPNSLAVVAAGHGHTVSHLGCLPSVVDAFISAGTVDGLDTSCVANGVPLPPFRTE